MEKSVLLSTEAGEENLFSGVVFRGLEHKVFLLENLNRCRYIDAYHLALIYCLGINPDCRRHIDEIYDFNSGCIKPECLTSGWQTSGSMRAVRLAFNLYTNVLPSVDMYEDAKTQLRESANYAVDEIFCDGNAKYFWQAVKLRYPEYCE